MTGTFLTSGGQTPVQAGLRTIATIGATPVYGRANFQPFNQAGNVPQEILCGGFTYTPQPVEGWIKGDGTLVDNVNATAGVNLVPTAAPPCSPAGVVFRLTLTLSPSADGRIPSVTFTEDKQIPNVSSVDWGSLSIATSLTPAFSYQLQSGGTINDFENWLATSQPANPGAGGRVWFDSTALKLKCVTSTGADCSPGGGSSLVTQTNGTNNASQTFVNFQNGSAVNGVSINFSNPSTGNEQAALSGTLNDAGLTSAYSGTGSCGANNWINSLARNAAPSCAQVGFSNLSGTIALGQTALTTRGDLLTVNATPALVRLGLGGANLYPKSNGTDVVYSSLAAGGVGSCSANQYVNALNADAAPGCAQVAYSQISGTPPLFYQTLQSAGVAQTQRPAFNFIQGANVTLTIADNSGSNRTDVTIAATGGGGSGCIPPGTTGNVLYDAGGGACSDFAQLTVSGNALTAGSLLDADYSTGHTLKLKVGPGSTLTAFGNMGQPLLANGDGTYTPGDPIVSQANWRLLNANVGGWAGQQLGPMAVYGKNPGLVLVPGMNAYVTNVSPGVRIGIADENGNNFTSNGTQSSINVGQDVNLLGVLGTQFSSPGFVDTNLAKIGGSAFALGARTMANSISFTPASDYTAPDIGPASPGTAATSAALIAGIFNTSPTTLTNGQQGAFQLDSTGSMLVHITAGAGSGGTAMADEAAFTEGTTNFTPAGCEFKTSPTNLTTGQAGVLECTNTRHLMIDLASILGTAPTTAGFLDIKGADGNIVVRSSTAANFLTTVTQGPAGATPWLFTINQGGNSATVNGSGQLSVNCAAGCSTATFTGTYNTSPSGFALTPLALSNGQTGNLQLDAGGRLLVINPDDAPILQALQGLQNSPRNLGGAGVFAAPAKVQIVAPAPTSDPCAGRKRDVAFSQTASAVVVSGLGFTHVCLRHVVSPDAETYSWIGGTGTASGGAANCQTGTYALDGATTAANGPSYAANEGTVIPGSGFTVMVTRNQGDDICLEQSGTGRVAGYVMVANSFDW